MPTLCLFLLPPSPAHPGALYLASSRTGCASIRRSRAGQDSQGPPPPHPQSIWTAQSGFIASPFWYCIVFVFCCGCVSNSLSMYPSVSLSLCLWLTVSLSFCVCMQLHIPVSLHLSLLSHYCSLGTQVKVPFNDWIEQYWAMIKQYPDPLKDTHTNTHTHCPEPGDWARNPGTSALMCTCDWLWWLLIAA